MTEQDQIAIAKQEIKKARKAIKASQPRDDLSIRFLNNVKASIKELTKIARDIELAHVVLVEFVMTDSKSSLIELCKTDIRQENQKAREEIKQLAFVLNAFEQNLEDNGYSPARESLYRQLEA